MEAVQFTGKERIVEVTVPQFHEELVQAVHLIPQELVRERMKEQIVVVPVLQLQEDPVSNW